MLSIMSHAVVLSAAQGAMATRMKLKLKTVFVLYFMVSLLGLIYALMQLGKWSPLSVSVQTGSISVISCAREHRSSGE